MVRRPLVNLNLGLNQLVVGQRVVRVEGHQESICLVEGVRLIIAVGVRFIAKRRIFPRFILVYDRCQLCNYMVVVSH